jgi:hypothetical protein
MGVGTSCGIEARPSHLFGERLPYMFELSNIDANAQTSTL